MTITDLRCHVADLATQFQRFHAMVDGAALCRELLALIDRLREAQDAEGLSLERAAEYSGYSPDHLRKLAKNGEIPVGRRGKRLVFRESDLPKKRLTSARSGKGSYHSQIDARRVAARRSHGGISHGSQAAA